MGHLETAVRILAMLAKAGGGCSTFEERLDVLLQAHYFLGRMASTVAETVLWGRRRRLHVEAVPEGEERNNAPFEEWWDASGEKGKSTKGAVLGQARQAGSDTVPIVLSEGRNRWREQHGGRTAMLLPPRPMRFR